VIKLYDYVDVLVDNCLEDRCIVLEVIDGIFGPEQYIVISKKYGKRIVNSKVVKEVG
jgi:hypothetical protein